MSHGRFTDNMQQTKNQRRIYSSVTKKRFKNGFILHTIDQ